MNELLIGLLGFLLATNQPQAISNAIHKATGKSILVPNPDDPVEKQYRKLLEDDDAARAEVDDWIKADARFETESSGPSQEQLRECIRARLAPVRQAYEDFLRRYPEHARARLAYGSFLNDVGDEEAAAEQWEKARQLDPNNPAAWNNLANYYGHRSPVKKAFEYYAKAIELNPFEPVYYQNLATTVFLFRTDAMEYYNINEQQVFDKALELYGKALKLDPGNFVLATDLAQTHYGIRPMRTEDAIRAWEHAMKLAGDEIERQGVHIHLARIKINAGRFDEAQQHLNAVTNAIYDVLKQRLLKNLSTKQAAQTNTNAPPPAAEAK